MPVFVYEVRDANGLLLHDEIEAENLRVAAQLLQEQKYTLLNIRERSAPPDPAALDAYRPQGTKWFFVGVLGMLLIAEVSGWVLGEHPPMASYETWFMTAFTAFVAWMVWVANLQQKSGRPPLILHTLAALPLVVVAGCMLIRQHRAGPTEWVKARVLSRTSVYHRGRSPGYQSEAVLALDDGHQLTASIDRGTYEALKDGETVEVQLQIWLWTDLCGLRQVPPPHQLK